MLDSTAAVAAERQGKNARQLLESVALEAGDEGIAHRRAERRPEPGQRCPHQLMPGLNVIQL
jgi:hypothetical protein